MGENVKPDRACLRRGPGAPDGYHKHRQGDDHYIEARKEVCSFKIDRQEKEQVENSDRDEGGAASMKEKDPCPCGQKGENRKPRPQTQGEKESARHGRGKTGEISRHDFIGNREISGLGQE